MLDNFNMGDPISEHDGVRCCPAMEKYSEEKYIVKIISVPASQSQLDALLLSGAYPDAEAALEYFKTVTDGILSENRLLEKLSQLDGFLSFDNCQIEPMEDGTGFDVYLLSPYRNTLQRHIRSNAMTHLDALNLGLDLCAALTVCRQSGYLYADLKPSNIYITDDRGFRIGDLGFLKLSSLKYASLPDRYRSEYTAPEITDAYSELNTTIDVYAIGLILYQVYNNGTLPYSGDNAVNGTVPAPAFADYEMAEIIQKACALNPEDRWQDPEALGQALVAYMQRNGANDTPIMPVSDAANEPEDAEVSTGTFEAMEDDSGEDTASQAETPADPDSKTESPLVASDLFTEDENGNLTFLTDDNFDETLPDEETANIPEAVVTEEVSNMLQQADELIAHPAPDPVVQPEPIDIPVPEIILPSPEPEAEEITEDVSADSETVADADVTEDENTARTDETEPASSDDPIDESAIQTEDGSENEAGEKETVEDNTEEEYVTEDQRPRRRARWAWTLVILAIILALIAGGIYYYRNYYLQNIASIQLLESGDTTLTVQLDTDTDENLLQVQCYDTYGTTHSSSPVKDGKAVFEGLEPNQKYTVKVTIQGFHKLTGTTTASYKTQNKITVSRFEAQTGATDGEIKLTFETDAPDGFRWIISYSADDAVAITQEITDCTATLSGLTVNKTYTFTLSSPDADNLVGETTVSCTAKKYIGAQNLTVTGCINNSLQLTWEAPQGVSVNSWTVRCTGGDGFDETKTVRTTTAEFTVPDPCASYLLEVVAADMTQGETTRSPANAVTIADMTIDGSDPNRLLLTWTAYGNIPTEGWTVLYTVDGVPMEEIHTEETAAELLPAVPDALYQITVQPVGEILTMGGTMDHCTTTASDFEGYGIVASDIQFTMCSRPAEGNWNRNSIASSDKRTDLSVAESIGLLLRINNTYNKSGDEILILFVTRDAEGNLLDCSTTTAIWDNIWSRGHGTLNVPYTPQSAGAYTLSVYFNGSLAFNGGYTITN